MRAWVSDVSIGTSWIVVITFDLLEIFAFNSVLRVKKPVLMWAKQTKQTKRALKTKRATLCAISFSLTRSRQSLFDPNEMSAFYSTGKAEISFLRDKVVWQPLAVSYQSMLQQSNGNSKKDSAATLSLLRTSHCLNPPLFVWNTHFLYVCPPSLPECVLPMHRSVAGAAVVPLCFRDWHVAVGVGRLSHCHSLDVMRKSTLDLPLWSALLEDFGESRLRVFREPLGVSRGRLIPGRLVTGPRCCHPRRLEP